MNVLFQSPKSILEIKYITDILVEDRFLKFIGAVKLSKSNATIIYLGEEKVGVIINNNYVVGGIKHAEPLLYIAKPSMYSQMIVYRLLDQLFNLKGVKSIILKIFSDNKLMLNLVSNFNIPECGRIYDVSSDLKRDLIIFQLDVSLYKKMFKEGVSYI